jgi:hypothetical protein
VEELLISFPREEYESPPYALLLSMLGGEVEDDSASGYFSDDLYSFDTECIEDHGNYARKVERLGQIAEGDLPIKNLRDYVDLAAGEAWIELELDGRTHRFEPAIDDDWFDPAVLTWLDSLAAERGSRRRLMYLDTGDQNVVVGFATLEQLKRLRRATGLGFVRLV